MREIAGAGTRENGTMRHPRRRRSDVRDVTPGLSEGTDIAVSRHVRSTPYRAFPAQKLRRFVH
jgi:hypothetical protein